jgi:secreted trypsin-like serine protease
LQLDEGNPLVCGGELAGIMSHSTNCGKNMRPSVYTEVYKYSDWIDSTIESMNSVAVSTLSSFVTMAMPVGLLLYWKGRE